MSLNIKNEETHSLAVALAKLTGESITAAVTVALRDRLKVIKQQQRSGKALLAEVRAITSKIAALDKGPFVDHGDLLYDENGLPK